MKLIKGILDLFMAVFILTGMLLSVPRLWGFQIYAVTSGSMEPKIRTGDVIYVKQVPFQSLEPGDVITFSMNQGRTVVTHRVEKIDVKMDCCRQKVMPTKRQIQPGSAGILFVGKCSTWCHDWDMWL